MTYIEHLILRARHFWDNGQNIDTSLVMEMAAAGLCVTELEAKYFVYD